MDHGFRREATRQPDHGAQIINLAAFRRVKAPPPPRMEFGSGAYHDAAIRAETARPRDA